MVAQRLLERSRMANLSWSFLGVLGWGIPLLLAAPVYGDPAPKSPSANKLRLVVQNDGPARSYDVVVAGDCATAHSKVSDREDEITVCDQREGNRFEIRWSTRRAAREYKSTGTLVLLRGASAELGSGDGPRLSVTLRGTGAEP